MFHTPHIIPGLAAWQTGLIAIQAANWEAYTLKTSSQCWERERAGLGLLRASAASGCLRMFRNQTHNILPAAQAPTISCKMKLLLFMNLPKFEYESFVLIQMDWTK